MLLGLSGLGSPGLGATGLGVLGFDLLRAELSPVLLAAPLLCAVGLWALAARRRARLNLVSERHLARFLPRFSENRARLRVLLACAAVLLLSLALLGPVRGYTLRDMRRRGLDLVVCIDTSRSMLVQDLKPDRLTRAKREVKGLLGLLGDDRAALLAFAGDVRSVAPLTHDRVTLGLFVETLDTEENMRGGTDIGGVLEHALGLFDGRTGSHEAVILITDGEDLGGRGREVAQRAAEEGIRVFVVGMGTAAGGKIPAERGFVRDEAGDEVVSVLDGTSLQQIADLTGGAYLSSESSPIPLEELFEKHISGLEGRELWAGKERVPHDRYQWPLVLAVVCMLGEMGLRERRARGAGEATRARRTSAAAGIVFLFALGPVASAQEAPSEAVPARYTGNVADGLVEIERLSDAGDVDGAVRIAGDLLAPSAFASWRASRGPGFVRSTLDVADPLFERLGPFLGWNGREPRVRAALHYAQGVVLARAAETMGDEDGARFEQLTTRGDDVFERARALAGPGGDRLASIYNLGMLDLFEGERQRGMIPELGGKPAAPPASLAPTGPPTGPLAGHTGPQGGGGEEDEPPPDPLDLAREAYERGLEHFVERLREDWRDADTRANVELIQRRLDELDDIERRREEEEQQQQQDDQDQQDQDENQDESQDQESEDSPSDEQQRDEPEPDEPQENEDEPQEEEPEEEPGEEPQEPEQPPESQEQQEPEERLLTREELMRLLDRLSQIEDQGERIREQLRQVRRAKVDKDW